MTLKEWEDSVQGTKHEIQERLNYFQEYFKENYPEDNISIINERFKNALVYMAEIPAMLRKASLIRDKKLSVLYKQYNPSMAKSLASAEIEMVREVESVQSLINMAHRTLQSQASLWKGEYIANSTNKQTT